MSIELTHDELEIFMSICSSEIEKYPVRPSLLFATTAYIGQQMPFGFSGDALIEKLLGAGLIEGAPHSVETYLYTSLGVDCYNLLRL